MNQKAWDVDVKVKLFFRLEARQFTAADGFIQASLIGLKENTDFFTAIRLKNQSHSSFSSVFRLEFHTVSFLSPKREQGEKNPGSYEGRCQYLIGGCYTISAACGNR